MIAPLNSEERSIVKAEATSLSDSTPTGDPAKEASEPISASATDVIVISKDAWIEAPLTYLGYYLEDANEYAQRSSQSPRSFQQKMVRTGLIGAGVLAALASGVAAIDALNKEQPEAKSNQPLVPPETSQNLEQTPLNAVPKPATPEKIGATPAAGLQFSLTPSPSIAQLGQATAQPRQATAVPSVLPELSTAQTEATQAAFSLPAPQLATAPETTDFVEPETQQPLALAQNQDSNLEPGTVNNFLNATSAGFPQPSEPNPVDLAPNSIANDVSPSESFATPQLSAIAASPIAAQTPTATSPNFSQSFVPDTTQPTSTTIANDFPRPTVQTVANPASSNAAAELALQPNATTVTMPGNRLLEAVPGQVSRTVVASPPANPQPPIELPEEVSPAVRNLLQVNPEAAEIQVAVMPLTQQESQEVALRDRLGQFKVLHLGQQDYQQEWRTSNGGANSPAPTFGFVDYPRRVIAVMQTPTSVRANPTHQFNQATSVSVPTEESVIVPE